MTLAWPFLPGFEGAKLDRQADCQRGDFFKVHGRTVLHGLWRTILFPLFPFKMELFPLAVGTKNLNDDKDLCHFFGFVPVVPIEKSLERQLIELNSEKVPQTLSHPGMAAMAWAAASDLAGSSPKVCPEGGFGGA